MEHNYQILLAEIKATIQAERTKAARQLSPVLPEGLSGVLPSLEEIKRRIQG